MRHSLYSVVAPVVLAALIGMSLPAHADPASVREVITAQMEALRSGDAAGAYAHAAPAIQRMFPTPERFISMVQKGYAPVADARSPVFLRAKEIDETHFAQEVGFNDENGRSWVALYTLALQPDGDWRITGCYLRKGEGTSA